MVDIDTTLIPDKFKTPEGNVNVQGMAQSYQALGGNPYDFIGADGNLDINRLAGAYVEREKATATPKIANSPLAELDIQNVETPDQIDWSKVQIGPDGKVPAAQRAQLIAAKIPDQFITEFEGARSARIENNVYRLASQLPNGLDDYNAVIEWANTSLPVEDRQRMEAALGSPAGDMALMGYYQRYINETGGAGASGGEPNMPDTFGGGAGSVMTGVQPFMNPRDRAAAFNPRNGYGTNPEFTALTHERARATSAHVVELQKTNPSRNWVAPTRRVKN